jgi:hypothetical protein
MRRQHLGCPEPIGFPAAPHPGDPHSLRRGHTDRPSPRRGAISGRIQAAREAHGRRPEDLSRRHRRSVRRPPRGAPPVLRRRSIGVPGPGQPHSKPGQHAAVASVSLIALDVGYLCYALSINWRLLVRDPRRWHCRLGRELAVVASERSDGPAASRTNELRESARAYLTSRCSRRTPFVAASCRASDPSWSGDDVALHAPPAGRPGPSARTRWGTSRPGLPAGSPLWAVVTEGEPDRVLRQCRGDAQR